MNGDKTCPHMWGEDHGHINFSQVVYNLIRVRGTWPEVRMDEQRTRNTKGDCEIE